MNSKTRRLFIDILVTLLFFIIFLIISRYLDLPLGGRPFGLSLLPIIWLAFRHGAPLGIIVGGLCGLIEGIYSLGWNDPLAVILTGILPYALVGLAGLFAKYSQKTLNNRRYSSTYLNISVGTLLAVLLFYLTKFSLSPMALNQASVINITQWDFWLTLGATWLFIAVLLALLARWQPSLLIPKRSKYLSRKETSSLLND